MEGRALIEKSELVYQGAEAKLYKGRLFDRDVIIKERFRKEYRHPDLDQRLSVRRIGLEARAMLRCSKIGLAVPGVLLVDDVNRLLIMDYINGPSFKDVLRGKESYDEECYNICREVGRSVGKMHASQNIHGDLTTSNILVADGRVVLIDFGLSSSSDQLEDKAVDLYVLERAFLSTHEKSEDLFQNILDSYVSSTKNPKSVLTRLEEVRQRGRKRSMVG